MIDIDDVPKYLLDHKDDASDVTQLVKKVVSYLRKYKVAPKHYSIRIMLEDKWIMIQIDEQCGYVDKQVSKSKFEFINGTCFSIEFNELFDSLQKLALKRPNLKKRTKKEREEELANLSSDEKKSFIPSVEKLEKKEQYTNS